MAFSIRNLSVLGYCNGFTSWHYRSADTIEEISASEYFAEAGDMITLGDQITVNAGNGHAILFVAPGSTMLVACAIIASAAVQAEAAGVVRGVEQ